MSFDPQIELCLIDASRIVSNASQTLKLKLLQADIYFKIAPLEQD